MQASICSLSLTLNSLSSMFPERETWHMGQTAVDPGINESLCKMLNTKKYPRYTKYAKRNKMSCRHTKLQWKKKQEFSMPEWSKCISSMHLLHSLMNNYQISFHLQVIRVTVCYLVQSCITGSGMQSHPPLKEKNRRKVQGEKIYRALMCSAISLIINLLLNYQQNHFPAVSKSLCILHTLK
jgi:hypothetical protein